MTTTEPFAAVDVIAVKRDGGRIPDEQLDWVIDAYTRGVVADEQMAALAMAILLNGMAPDELARWTAAMIASGERLDLSGVSRPTTDKHSTGASETRSRCRWLRWSPRVAPPFRSCRAED